MLLVGSSQLQFEAKDGQRCVVSRRHGTSNVHSRSGRTDQSKRPPARSRKSAGRNRRRPLEFFPRQFALPDR
ncbi:unnamed protein product [Parajaminaea phylloscopi]